MNDLCSSKPPYSDEADATTYNTNNDHKPDNYINNLGKICYVMPWCVSTSGIQRLGKLNSDVEVENGRAANGSKKPHKSSLTDTIDLWDLLIQS
jgi:hypothetical protein